MWKRLFFNDKFIFALILLNFMVIFIQEFNYTPTWLAFIDGLLTLVFVVEVSTKICLTGFRTYIKDNWNKLDFFVTVLSIPSVWFIFTTNDAAPFSFLVALRALRVFKFFRLFKFAPNIKRLLRGVQNALKASSLVILGFTVLTLIASLLTCAIFQDIAPEYFANPVDAFYSIFRIFSMEGWYEIPNLIAERCGTAYAFFSKFYFILLLFFGGILGLSLVNSIFVDAMLSDNNDDLISKIESLEEKIEKLTNTITNKEDGL